MCKYKDLAITTMQTLINGCGHEIENERLAIEILEGTFKNIAESFKPYDFIKVLKIENKSTKQILHVKEVTNCGVISEFNDSSILMDDGKHYTYPSIYRKDANIKYKTCRCYEPPTINDKDKCSICGSPYK